MVKRYVLALLVCVNLLLLTAVVLVTTAPKAAFAQTTGGGGGTLSSDFLVVSVEAQTDFDGLFILDQKARQLHAFQWDNGPKRLRYAGYRDLEQDFRARD
jgi:hypothetical protein